MVALGIVGGVAYGLLYYRVFQRAFQCWRESRAAVVLALTAIILTLAGHWLNTGDYSTISLAWFCIGALDRYPTPRVPAGAKG
jgi:O-antigen ligase